MLERKRDEWKKIIDGTKSASQIAKECSVNRQTVYYVSKKYGFPLLKDHMSYIEYHGVPTEQLKAELKIMTVSDVAKKHDLSPYLLKEWCYSRGIEFKMNRPRRLSPVNKTIEKRCRRTGETMDMIKFLIPEFTNASIARVFGYSKERIRQIRNELNETTKDFLTPYDKEIKEDD